MIKTQANHGSSKSSGLVFFEYCVFALCLCVIALRVTLTESPAAQSDAQPINIGSNIFSLSMSAVLASAFICWFVWSFCSRKFLYRLTGIEIGLGLFVIAAVIAGFVASNKRAAITDFVIIITPVLMILLLVQILDSQTKIKLVLAVIAALGVVLAYRCADQLFVENQERVKQYQEDPNAMLGQLGIEQGSFNQMMFEHRLYSKDIGGFFTTGNSAGSFLLLASFCAAALVLERLRNSKSVRIVPACIAIAGILLALAITHSKGAIAAAIIAAAMFIVYLLFGKWLGEHKRAILIILLLLVLAGVGGMVLYGLTYQTLPGGNSMLVRWQYWATAVKIYGLHPITGIGPGSFTNYYMQYKPPAALETVSDPHNFLLRILTQYGPLGLVGFLAIVLVPLYRTIYRRSVLPPTTAEPEQSFKKLAVSFVVVISLAMLFIRPVVLPVAGVADSDVMFYVEMILYVAPVVVFVIGFWLITTGEKTIEVSDTIAIALFCACAGVLIHNLIDFAIFEPGVLTPFCAVAACLIALNFQRDSRQPIVFRPPFLLKVVVAAGGAAVIWAYFNCAFIPVAKATVKIESAFNNTQAAHSLLESAAKDDLLDPSALNLDGRLYLQEYGQIKKKQPDYLEKAAKCFIAASERDRIDFKNYEKLTEVYNLLDQPQQAYDWCLRALEYYPGSDRLRIELAKLAERLEKTDAAIANYKQALEIEDSYRRQFEIMYPGKKIFSRLGEEKYQLAKQRIKSLSPQPAP
ncbi:MAG: O-antigen ligase family protein [Planctomycetota bacterium]|nr:O-antigen ligase family protein [Planctomycetota bacterium]